jgi:hypothetical protein
MKRALLEALSTIMEPLIAIGTVALATPVVYAVASRQQQLQPQPPSAAHGEGDDDSSLLWTQDSIQVTIVVICITTMLAKLTKELLSTTFEPVWTYFMNRRTPFSPRVHIVYHMEVAAAMFGITILGSSSSTTGVFLHHAWLTWVVCATPSPTGACAAIVMKACEAPIVHFIIVHTTTMAELTRISTIASPWWIVTLAQPLLTLASSYMFILTYMDLYTWNVITYVLGSLRVQIP